MDKEISTTVTQRGQVTIPAEVRRLLGLKPKDKVVFKIRRGEVRLTPVAFTLSSAYGSATPLTKPGTLEQISQAAKDEKVEDVVRSLRKR